MTHFDNPRARTQLLEISNLPAGWDSYSAKPIDRAAIYEARSLLDVLPGGDWTAVPMADGSVQLERHRDGFDIEIHVSAAAGGQS